MKASNGHNEDKSPHYEILSPKRDAWLWGFGGGVMNVKAHMCLWVRPGCEDKASSQMVFQWPKSYLCGHRQEEQNLQFCPPDFDGRKYLCPLNGNSSQCLCTVQVTHTPTYPRRGLQIDIPEQCISRQSFERNPKTRADMSTLHPCSAAVSDCGLL